MAATRSNKSGGGSRGSSSRGSSSSRGKSSGGSRGGSGKTTRDHDEIRNWAEERGGQPACVTGTGGKGDTGVLRIDFPGGAGEDKLHHIEWDEWFEKFDDKNLQFLYQDGNSTFNKLISGGSGSSSRSGSRSGGGGGARGRGSSRDGNAGKTSGRAQSSSRNKGTESRSRGSADKTRGSQSRSKSGSSRSKTAR